MGATNDLLIAIVLTTALVCVVTSINPMTTINCHVRRYLYNASKPIYTEEGNLLHCHETIWVNSCWGRCDSLEIPDYRVPFKKSYHRVCTFSKQRRRQKLLANCHPDHTDPVYTYFEAAECGCRKCTPDHTSCENL